MVHVESKVLELLKDKELKFFQQALETNNIPEIKHWQKVIKSREKVR